MQSEIRTIPIDIANHCLPRDQGEEIACRMLEFFAQ